MNWGYNRIITRAKDLTHSFTAEGKLFFFYCSCYSHTKAKVVFKGRAPRYKYNLKHMNSVRKGQNYTIMNFVTFTFHGVL